jgi:hypothetical protein
MFSSELTAVPLGREEKRDLAGFVERGTLPPTAM